MSVCVSKHYTIVAQGLEYCVILNFTDWLQMIEESEERFKTDQEVEELLAVIATKLPFLDGETNIQDSRAGQESIADGHDIDSMET